MKSFPFILFAMVSLGCNPSGITMTWRADNPEPSRYHKILVVAIVQSDNDSLKKSVENVFVKKLAGFGYNAASAAMEFGRGGLSNMGEAETYKKLCDEGVDAVMTIALVDANKEPPGKYGELHNYPSNYYFSHIWNYKNITAAVDPIGEEDICFWEAIIFNLSTLEAECAIQSPVFKEGKLVKATREFEAKSIEFLSAEKILVKQKVQPNRKAF